MLRRSSRSNNLSGSERVRIRPCRLRCLGLEFDLHALDNSTSSRRVCSLGCVQVRVVHSAQFQSVSSCHLASPNTAPQFLKAPAVKLNLQVRCALPCNNLERSKFFIELRLCFDCAASRERVQALLELTESLGVDVRIDFVVRNHDCTAFRTPSPAPPSVGHPQLIHACNSTGE